MSTKNSLLTVGLAALGVYGVAAVVSARADDAQPAPGPVPATAPAAVPAPSQAVLLLFDGRTLEGIVREEGAEYVLRQPGGEIRFDRDRVERVCGSLVEVYQYKRGLVPDDDPDEHLKLARWCLSRGLREQARDELRKVIAVSSHSAQAQAMLASIEATDSRASNGAVDGAVMRTSGTVVEPPAGAGAGAGPARSQAPAELDPMLLRRMGREMGVSGQPVIFDLPPAVAVKRADQFSRNVHPILQAACARCHNERYDGAFQLVQVKSKKDWTPAVFRTNLDATLNLVDRDRPAQSELLSRSLVPHGNTQSRQPVFRGSNDPRFQILSAWVNSLRPAAPLAGGDARLGGPTRDAGVAPAGGGGFASERSAGPLPFTPTPSGAAIPPPGAGPSLPPNVRQEVIAPPSTRFVPGRGMVIENTPPSADEFPVSPLLQGRTAGMPARQGPAPAAPGNPAPLDASAQGLPRPAVGPESARPSSMPPGVRPEAEAGPVPAAAPAQVEPVPSAPGAGTTAKGPVKFDPKLLQKALMNRNIRR